MSHPYFPWCGCDSCRTAMEPSEPISSESMNEATAKSLTNEICDLCHDFYSDENWSSDERLRADVETLIREALDDASKPPCP